MINGLLANFYFFYFWVNQTESLLKFEGDEDSRISSLVALVAINLVLTIVLLALYVFSVYNINSFVKSTGDDANKVEDKPAENGSPAAEDNQKLINESAP